MNTEICRHIFDATANSAFPNDKPFRALLASPAYCCRDSVSEAEAQSATLHVQPVRAKNHEAIS